MASAKPRRHVLFCAVTAITSLVMATFAGCDTDAVGVESCRTIEARRCELAPRCAKSASWATEVRTEDEVTNCKTFYRDHCLNGIENPSGDPSTEKTDACVKAMDAVGKCASDGVADLTACGVASTDGAATPCAALGKIQILEACAFVAAKPSTTASTTGDTSATTDATATTDTASSSSTGMGGGGS